MIAPTEMHDWPDRAVRWLASSSHPGGWALFYVTALVILLELARARTRRWFVAARLRAQAGRALEAEARAARLLSRAGYRVVGAQMKASYDLLVDGRRLSIALRADYVVERRGRWFVAEVKSGETAPSLETPATRRQLLEYRIAFAVDGVLLVDAERDTVHEVIYLPNSRSARAERSAAFLARL